MLDILIEINKMSKIKTVNMNITNIHINKYSAYGNAY